MNWNPRKFMEKAVEVMKKSVSENRQDNKVSPKVGIILTDDKGKFMDESYRGELREGDHAEFTLLERKYPHTDLTDFYIFTTLEPCAPGSREHPKLSCAERIVNARIKKVWIGLEDPDMTVDRKGIRYLQDNGIEVQMFDEDLQDIIRTANEAFIRNVRERIKTVEEKLEIKLNDLENSLDNFTIEDFSKEALLLYKEKARIKYEIDSNDFKRLLLQQGYLFRDKNGNIAPTGNGILLFGENPSNAYPNVVVKLIHRENGKIRPLPDFKDCLVLLPNKIEDWLKSVLKETVSRESFARTIEYDMPIPPLREAFINALVHMDYSITGAHVYIEIDDNKVVVKSAGLPVEPIKLEDLQNFKAPTLSRNPRIMYVFDELEFVEQRGIGMSTFKSLPEKYNMPLPSIKYENLYLTITFFRNDLWLKELIGQEKYSQLKEDEKQQLTYIYNIEQFSRVDFEKSQKMETRTAQRQLKRFDEELDLIKSIKKGKSTVYKKNF